MITCRSRRTGGARSRAISDRDVGEHLSRHRDLSHLEGGHAIEGMLDSC
jgi:hypothetical protein